MKTHSQHVTLIVALAGALALSACGKKEEPAPPPAATPAPAPAPTTPPPAATPAPAPVAVASVDLGNAVDAEGKKVTAPMTTFAAKDTIYAAVSTTGSAPTATLTAKWTYQDGQLVSSSDQPLAPNGDAVTTFHIAKPDGWPTGNYKVEILLDGKSVATKDFSVK